MLEVIEKVLRIVAALLQRQAEKDAHAVAEAERRVEELRQEMQVRYAHRAKCNNLSKRLKSLSDEV